MVLDVDELSSLTERVAAVGSVENVLLLAATASETMCVMPLLSGWDDDWITPFRAELAISQRALSDWLSDYVNRRRRVMMGALQDAKPARMSFILSQSTMPHDAGLRSQLDCRLYCGRDGGYGAIRSERNVPRIRDENQSSEVIQESSTWLECPLVNPHIADCARECDGRPRYVPNSQDYFVGRQDELEAIRNALRIGGPLVVSGPIGIGKSRLVEQYLWQEGQSSKSPVTWISGPCRIETFLEREVSEVASEDNRMVGQRYLLWPRLLENESVVVFDGFDGCSRRAHDQLVWYCDQSSLTSVIITTRDSEFVLSAHKINLGPLGFATLDGPGKQIDSTDEIECDAVALIQARLSELAVVGEDWTRDRKVIVEICRHVDCSPLGIERIARQLTVLSISEVHERLGVDRTTFGIDLSFGARDQYYGRMLDATWHLLCRRHRSLLIRLSIFRGSFSEAGAVALGCRRSSDAQSVAQTKKCIDEVCHMGWVESDEQKSPLVRFRMSPLLRDYVLSRGGEVWGRDAATRYLHAEYTLELVEDALGEESEFGDVAGSQLLDGIADDVLCAFGEACGGESRLAKRAVRVAEALWRFWVERALVQRVLRFAEAISNRLEFNSELELCGRMLDVIGMMHYAIGDLESAAGACERSVRLLKGTDSRSALSIALIHLAGVRAMSGDVEEAHRMAMESYSMAKLGDSTLQYLEICGIAADVCVRCGFGGDADQILTASRETLDVESGAPRRRARIYLRLGTIAAERGEYHLAAHLLQSAAAQAKLIAGGRELGRVQTELAIVRRWQGRHEDALDLLLTILRSSLEMGDRLLHLSALCNVADMWCDEMRWSEVSVTLRRIREYGGDGMQSDVLLDVRNMELITSCHCGDIQGMSELYETVSELSRLRTDVVSTGWAWRTLAMVACEIGDYSAAASWATESVEHFRRIGNKGGLLRSIEVAARLVCVNYDLPLARCILVACEKERLEIGAPRTLRENTEIHRWVSSGKQSLPNSRWGAELQSVCAARFDELADLVEGLLS
ncbi:MAG: tetratricopeptide repeat protein [Anaerolineae bacterium]